MNLSTTVKAIRKAKNDARILSRTGGIDATNAAAAVDHLNKALTAMGQDAADHIPMTMVVAATPSGQPAAASTSTAPTAAPFGNIPPPPAAPRSTAKYDQKKSAEAVEPEPEKAATKAEPAKPKADAVDTKLAAAANAGQITEVDQSKATLEQIVSSTNEANLERLGGVTGVQKLTEAIGGKPAPDKSDKQQATILKAAAKKALKK